MYQVLYRKWRPQTFDDVVGQEHITDTLKRQVETGRLSHAYLFTGTRGTGKTTCAKILARAVNCEHPVNGNPCNECPSCRGILNGSVLDVLELDAASNNKVDDIRAILDEAAYTPASVKKRVYIVDEVHMLSGQAFNALLQILEEPPEHLMFILATTELHKVPATIKSRCQQFSFKRIRPEDIAARLRFVSQQEGISLSLEAAALLARLADGGLRDALSLLDQCRGDRSAISESDVLTELGLAGNLETAALMGDLLAGRTPEALESLDRLYSGGKEMSALLGELSSLARDLLIRKTAPGGTVLMTGGYDEVTMKNLAAQCDGPRLVHMLTVLQQCSADLARSTNRRTDTELCLVRLSDPSVDGGDAGLSARVSRLEELAQNGAVVPAAQRPAPAAQAPADAAQVPAHAAQRAAAAPAAVSPAPGGDRPPWETDEPPRAVPESAPPEPVRAPSPAPQRRPDPERSPAPAPSPASGKEWNAVLSALKDRLSVADFVFIGNPDMVAGRVAGDTVTLWADTDFTKSLISTPELLRQVEEIAGRALGRAVHAGVKVGSPPPESASAAPSAPPSPPASDGFEDLLDELSGLDNVTIT